ncbi:energy-coupling factor transporter ATPase [Alteribacter natronophilus]|uniref:energy-coupling factor transporter ATPase n=1 Tax=Alteribacter natronophilus TaxID=2583810 RepID=UPI00110EC597|nr:energy-coupling factor transporter ATPase [Alteribacter natronophilus]TMW70055.1 energy-coupling factor transporter ATPase [Alteribacter natronophilus]
MAEETAVQVNNVTYRYAEGAPSVLSGLSLKVEQNEWVAITGHNGSGKSTLARLINGLLLPEHGDILVQGLNSASEDDKVHIRRKVGMVFQNPDNQIVAPTVQDDVAFGLENTGVDPQTMEKRVAWAIKAAGLAGLEHAEPHNLSGGQKQRVAIAGILALKPDILVLDEATSMLDPLGKKEVMSLAGRLHKEENVTVISITHDLEEVLRADRMIVMNQGVVTADGKPDDVFREKEILDRAGLEQPFSVRLREELARREVVIPENAVSEKAMVSALCRLKHKT